MSEDRLPEEKMLQVRSLRPIKLKDKNGRHTLRINMKETFGFVPDEIVIQKVQGQNNHIVVSAVLTEEEIAREKKAIDELTRKKVEGMDKSKGKPNKKGSNRRPNQNL